MTRGDPTAPLTDVLRRAIVESKVAYKTLERATGVQRGSIMRFVRGSQSLRLDKADRLAAYFGLELRLAEQRRKGN
jgi:plasmid maintenance system antidote protein VapI